jgi:AcrR family transcriptional regulator
MGPVATETQALEPPALSTECAVRADAARNRAKLVKAAEHLFTERGVENVSMDEIAAAAGVGKGTLFRRFGDRAGLVRALVQARDADFHESVVSGPAPLGPGAPPRDRLIAFGEGLLDQLECHGTLALEAERGSSACDRYQSEIYAFYRAHVSYLLAAAAPDTAPDYLADVLLSALSADFLSYQRSIRELSLDECKSGWRDLVERLLPAQAPAR